MPTPKLTATTPHGTFTRETAHPYTFVAVIGDTPADPKPGARWSTSRQGAQRLANEVLRWNGHIFGIYPVDSQDRARTASGSTATPEDRTAMKSTAKKTSTKTAAKKSSTSKPSAKAKARASAAGRRDGLQDAADRLMDGLTPNAPKSKPTPQVSNADTAKTLGTAPLGAPVRTHPDGRKEAQLGVVEAGTREADEAGDAPKSKSGKKPAPESGRVLPFAAPVKDAPAAPEPTTSAAEVESAKIAATADEEAALGAALDAEDAALDALTLATRGVLVSELLLAGWCPPNGTADADLVAEGVPEPVVALYRRRFGTRTIQPAQG